ncbi:hypothetical protein [Nonomuraea guangzhouensis]|uniref:Uncharacterized protein n=1 Tax=Nonomuraea guangzhouensis TaxID=1291555 RepID=A0ABW4GER2_9ACTN|nr:hypothetical protein [Nonomuraea guangzhouensis]
MSDEVIERAEQVADERLDVDEYYTDVERRAVLLVEKEVKRRRARLGLRWRATGA